VIEQVERIRVAWVDTDESRPASTLVEVSRLAIPGAKIEVEAVAGVRG
jgi:enamine deaminase RidA (YjgF/YER057c/UK114 family)